MEMGSYLCTWAVSFRRWPNLLNQGGMFPIGTQSFLSSFPFLTQCHHVLKVRVNFPCVSGRFVMRRIRLSYLSFDRSLPLPHPPFLGEADISANDRYRIIYSERGSICYFSSSSFFGVVDGSWVVSGFPPGFLKVAERVRVAMAEARGMGRSQVGLG